MVVRKSVRPGEAVFVPHDARYHAGPLPTSFEISEGDRDVHPIQYSVIQNIFGSGTVQVCCSATAFNENHSDAAKFGSDSSDWIDHVEYVHGGYQNPIAIVEV
jgi:hypothetical protein